MRNRFVKIVRLPANRPLAKMIVDRRYYEPVELKNGNLYQLGTPHDAGRSVHGFEKEADAWRVIDAIEARERAE